MFGNLFLSQAFGEDRVFARENNFKIPATDRYGASCYVKPYSGSYYHYKPIPENLIAKSSDAKCDDRDGYLGAADIIEYYAGDRLHAVAFSGGYQTKIPNPLRSYAFCSEYGSCMVFDDGEVWKFWREGWTGWGMEKIRDSNAVIEQKSKAAEIAAKKEKVRNNQFRKSIKVGDDTSNGIIIEIKGNLVKIQSENSQCSQRNHNGSCVNWIYTPVEKWVKRSEIYPK